MMGIRASSQFIGRIGMWADWKCDHEPVPTAKPKRQKIRTIARIRRESAFCVSLPAPKWQACKTAKTTKMAAAVSERGENVNAPTEKLMVSNAWSEASRGKYCPR